MSAFQWIVLCLAIFTAVTFPMVLVKAIRRKEWQRVYEVVVETLFLVGFVLIAALPAIIDKVWNAWPLLRWLWLLPTVLLVANRSGFSRWLFNRNKEIPVERS